MVGSSTTFGAGVSRQDTYAAILPEQLSRILGRPVELYNEGMGFGASPQTVAYDFKSIVDESPDMILWTLTPNDFVLPDAPAELKGTESGSGGKEEYIQKVISRLKFAIATRSLPMGVWNIWDNSEDTAALQHFVISSESRAAYVRSYLARGYSSGFLSAKPSPQWETNFRQFDMEAANFLSLAHAAGVPVVATLVPDRAEAAMISMGQWPDGSNPYAIGERTRQIIEKHGGTYVDILQGFRTVPDAESGYFPVDGHPNAGGHAVISELLASQLTSGVVAPLTPRNRPETRSVAEVKR